MIRLKTNIKLLLFLLTFGQLIFAQENKNDTNYFVSCVGFYNLENLFDTIADPDTTKILQTDFTPKGEHHWTSEKYHIKINNMAKVISQIGTDVTPDGLVCLGVAEIENQTVLNDLVNNPQIKNRNYQIVHYESPDKRGIDVAFLYNPSYFKVISSKTFTLKIPDNPDFFTRDQLLVNGTLNGELIHVIVAHWPSRRGGEKRSRPMREAAADLARSIIDSLQNVEPNAKVIFMGDLNDDPVNSSLKKHLKTEAKQENVSDKTLFNPMESLYNKGIGTLGYRDVWDLFDQIVLSKPFLGKDYSSLKYYTAKVYNKPYMKQTEGRYKGYPKRTFAGDTFLAGYSDHFPVYIFLIKQK